MTAIQPGVAEAGRPQFLPSAWYNLGTLHQQREQWTEAAEAYERALSTGDPEFAPKAATNLGFVRANYLNDVAGAGGPSRPPWRQGIPSRPGSPGETCTPWTSSNG